MKSEDVLVEVEEAGIVPRPRRDWDKVVRRKTSIEKARKVLGYEPKTDMKTGLNKTCEWIRLNQEHIEKAQSL